MMLRKLIPLALAALLAACATPQSLKPGMTIPEALSAAGRPTAEIKLPDGGTRLQYSGQPQGQWVWNADFDAQGRLRTVEQMMSDDAFLRIRAGKDTQADILRDFGKPAEVVQYSRLNESAFMYRYYTSARLHAAMFVYFNPAGVVTRTETGPDPWRLNDTDRGR